MRCSPKKQQKCLRCCFHFYSRYFLSRSLSLYGKKSHRIVHGGRTWTKPEEPGPSSFLRYFLIFVMGFVCTPGMNLTALNVIWTWATFAEQKLIRIDGNEWKGKSFTFAGVKWMSSCDTRTEDRIENRRRWRMERRYRTIFIIHGVPFVDCRLSRLISIFIELVCAAITWRTAMDGRTDGCIIICSIRGCDFVVVIAVCLFAV